MESSGQLLATKPITTKKIKTENANSMHVSKFLTESVNRPLKLNLH